MERVYVSWPAALVTLLILGAVAVYVLTEVPASPTSYLVFFVLILAAALVVLSAMGKLPLYRLR